MGTILMVPVLVTPVLMGTILMVPVIFMLRFRMTIPAAFLCPLRTLLSLCIFTVIVLHFRLPAIRPATGSFMRLSVPTRTSIGSFHFNGIFRLQFLYFTIHDLFNRKKKIHFVRAAKRNSHTGLTGTTGTADTVNVGLRFIRKFKVKYVCNLLDINSSGSNIRCYQNLGIAGFETFQSIFTLSHGFISMDRIGFDSFLGKTLYQFIGTVFGTSEHNRLLYILFL